MAFGSPELGRGAIVEHGTSAAGRWLRMWRLRLALAVAIAEAVLVVAGVVPRLVALAVAVGAIAFYLSAGRNLRSDAARQASWIAAASQALVALVPVLVIVVGGLALVAVAILAVVALVILFSDRR